MSDPNASTSSSADAESVKNDMYDTIDSESTDTNESRATKELYDALVQHRKELSGEHALPKEDQALSEQIRSEAARRSAEITSYQRTSGRQEVKNGKPIPAWLIVLWIIAVVAAGFAVAKWG